MAKLIFMNKQFEILKAGRDFILKTIENLTLAQFNKIPNGFKNNIAWNMAHLVVTQQLLCYKMSGLTPLVTQEMIEAYKKGTAPTAEISLEEVEQIKKKLLNLSDRFLVDYKAGIFQHYQAYTTSAGVTLNNVEDAIAFNNFHEGIHVGTILSLKKHI